MKISKLRLGSYLHFKKGLQIDLTYPAGHAKAGQPLDKICFLGQSGTGKTSLLNIIKYFVCDDELQASHLGLDNVAIAAGDVEVFYKAGSSYHSKIAVGDRQFRHFDSPDDPMRREIDNLREFKGALAFNFSPCIPRLINFPFCVVAPEDLGVKKGPVQELNEESGELVDDPDIRKAVWDFEPESIRIVWTIVLRRVAHYLKAYRAKMADYFEDLKEEPSTAEKLMNEFKNWERDNPNPLQKLADECLTPILAHFDLEVETDLRKYKPAT